MSTTTVLVNLTWLVPGVVGGSEESVTDALRAIDAAEPDDVTLRLAVLEPFAAAHADLAARHPCDVLALDGSSKPRRVLAEQTWLARRASEAGAQVVHHAGGTVPLVHPGAVVLTVQDLQPLDLPQNFSTAKRLYLRAMLGRSARAAARVVVPSEFTRGRVVELLGADPDRVVVVPWTPRPAPSVPAAPPTEPWFTEEPYFLYPAITYPHKNHAVLVEAFARLGGPRSGPRLVLTGGEGPREAAVAELVERRGLGDRVLRTGRVGRDRLESLYAGAAGVLVPSRYEGFGLPALEAMARRIPVVVSDAGSLPEVCRPDEVVPADDVTAWVDAVQAVLDLDADRRRARVAAGAELVARLTPDRTAAGLLDAYRSAAPHR